ncbi:MAG: MFS transporter [Chloroflexi bacterium]|nr:MFS transporter [Chloroflexota bacterium]
MAAIFGFTAAMQMQMVAQGWLVFHLTGSNLALGTVTFVWSISMALFSPLAGALADRVSRRRLLIMTWGAAAGIFATISFLILTEQIQLWHLIAAALLNGVLFAFNIPARFALLSQLVTDAQLMPAMALLSIAFNFSGIVFPLVAGGIIDMFGPAGAYAVTATLYMLAAAVLGFLPVAKVLPSAGRSSIAGDLVAGFRFVYKDATLRWLLLLALVAVVLGQVYGVMLPGYAAETLGVPAAGLGLLLSVFGLGALASNVLLANLGPTARLGKWMFILGVASGLALVLLAFTRSLYPALAVLFLLGLTGPPFMTVNQTLVQLRASPQFRGRVQSIYMLTFAAMPLGAIPLAAMGDKWGTAVPFILAGASTACLIALIAWLRRPLVNLSAGQPAIVSPNPLT